MKTTMTKVKNPMDGFSSRVNTAEKGIRELEKSEEIIINVAHRDKRRVWKRRHELRRKRGSNICLMLSLREARERGEME